MKGCKHEFLKPVGNNREAVRYDPGICASCGVLVDSRTFRPMTPLQIETWANDLMDERLRGVSVSCAVSNVEVRR